MPDVTTVARLRGFGERVLGPFQTQRGRQRRKQDRGKPATPVPSRLHQNEVRRGLLTDL
jgi:hypothetical protein